MRNGTFFLRLRDRQSALRQTDRQITLHQSDSCDLVLTLPSADDAKLLISLATSPGLNMQILQDHPAAARLFAALEQIQANVPVMWDFYDGSDLLMRVVPKGAEFVLGAPHPEPEALQSEPLPLGACLRPGAEAAGGDDAFLWRLDIPGSACDIQLSDPSVAAIPYLLSASKTGSWDATLWALKSGLWQCGVMQSQAATPPNMRHWATSDRVFHDITRPKGPPAPFAAKSGLAPRLDWQSAPLPARPPQTQGVGFAEVLHRRRTKRDFLPRAPDLATLSMVLSQTFGYRAVKGLAEQRWVERAVPAAGGLGDITAYLVMAEGRGPVSGVLRYDPQVDELTPICGVTPATAQLIQIAGHTMQRPHAPPPCVVILACRVDALAWKYGDLAYRLALLNAGVALGTLHLVAESHGLGGCALGSTGTSSIAGLLAQKPPDDSPLALETPLIEMALGLPKGLGQ